MMQQSPTSSECLESQVNRYQNQTTHHETNDTNDDSKAQLMSPCRKLGLNPY
ncbi:hypothetical protein Glove_134g68 [Diversispora epigaea]|uniref:Uncharacterized protein n=1 Tax=Diversispora epigaea TaxID=1348612 RepID=A0A397IXB1_9GLOM|nr:hypothetical protein Glove_134g68 [Diversispora epigaea]